MGIETEYKFDPPSGAAKDFVIGKLNAKIESDAKVIATLRNRMTQIRAFVIVMNENNWRDIGDRIARQAAEYEQDVGK